jgi:CHAT domain-containing protein/tetratricopeptide (TPR) repeat protein
MIRKEPQTSSRLVFPVGSSLAVLKALQTFELRSSQIAAGLLLAILLFFSWPSNIRPDLPKDDNVQATIGTSVHLEHRSDDPYLLQAEADRFYWQNNGFKAAPLYAKAEQLFAARGDIRNEIHAKVGRVRAEAEKMSFVDVSHLLDEQLRSPFVQADSKLRLWCLIAKGYTDIEIDYRLAKQDWLQAKDIANSLGENQWVTRASGELGLVAFLEGNLGQAARLVGGALISTITTGDTGGQIRFLELIGTGFEEVNRHSEALKLFERAIKLANTQADSGFPFIAFEGKAQALLALGKSSEAKQILEIALAQARLQQKRGHEAQVLILLGKVDAKAGDRKQAIAYFEDATRISKQVQFFRMEADTMFELAKLYGDTGDVVTSTARAVQGLVASQRINDRYYVPRNLTVRAELEALQGRVAQANTLYTRAEGVIEDILLSVGEPYWNSSIAGSMSQTYLQHFELLYEKGDFDAAFRVLESIRGRTLVWSLEDRRAFRTTESKQTVALENDLANVQMQLMRTANASERALLLDKLVEDERRLGWAWVESRTPHQRLRVVTLTKMKQDLQPDELFLEYVLDDPRSFCLSISKRGAYARALPAGRGQIEKLTQEFIAEIRSKGADTGISRQLYALLVKPIPETESATRLVIAPEGILNLLPFEALRDAQGKYLLKSRIISYVPSGTTLDTLRHIGKRQLAPKMLLAVGDVAYEDQVNTALKSRVPATSSERVERGSGELAGIELHDLPKTREEVEEIGKLFGQDAVVLLGKDATETAFKREPLDQFRILHLAVHGLADTQYPERSALVLGIDPTSGDDGLLQAREIIRLRLNAELTTLSACDSGVGLLQGQEGISNLVEAFLVAGSKSVVASLWGADDTFASALMEEFYSHLAEGDDLGHALRNAKLDLLARYGEQASPFYWAGFVIVGDATKKIPTAFNK